MSLSNSRTTKHKQASTRMKQESPCLHSSRKGKKLRLTGRDIAASLPPQGL